MRLIDFFDRGVGINPSRTCLKDATVSRTFREVQLRSYRIANALAAAGLKPGQMAAVYSPNGATAFECILGILRGANIWVPINARNSTEDNAYILDNCDVQALFYHSEFEANVAGVPQGVPADPPLYLHRQGRCGRALSARLDRGGARDRS